MILWPVPAVFFWLSYVLIRGRSMIIVVTDEMSQVLYPGRDSSDIQGCCIAVQTGGANSEQFHISRQCICTLVKVSFWAHLFNIRKNRWNRCLRIWLLFRNGPGSIPALNNNACTYDLIHQHCVLGGEKEYLVNQIGNMFRFFFLLSGNFSLLEQLFREAETQSDSSSPKQHLLPTTHRSSVGETLTTSSTPEDLNVHVCVEGGRRQPP